MIEMGPQKIHRREQSSIRAQVNRRAASLVACVFVVGGMTPAGQSATNEVNVPPPYVVRSWQTKDGLPHNLVRALVQTRDGYLWLGTAAGLARFDGSRFRTFGLQDGLPSIQILALAEDEQGSLWIGTAGGGLIRWSAGGFSTVPGAEALSNAILTHLVIGRDGTVWIGTEQGLFRWHGGACSPVALTEGLPPGPIGSLMEDKHGALWVSVLLSGLYQRSNGKFAPAPGFVKNGSVYQLFEDRGGNIWVGCGNGLLWEKDRSGWQVYSKTNGLPVRRIVSLGQGEQDEIWVGMRDGGLFYFSDGTFKAVTRRYGLADDRVGSLTVDREGTVWVGSGSGLNRLTPRRLIHWGASEGLPESAATSVAEDGSGGIWVGTPDKGIYRFIDGRFSRVREPEIINTYPHIYCTLGSEDGTVWAAGEGQLLEFHPGQTPKAYTGGIIHAQAVRALCEDGPTLWLGTYHSALLRFADGKIQMEVTNGVFAGDIRCLVREAPGMLWVGTATGLYRWERGKTEVWDTSKGLLCATVESLHRDPDGTLWIGTMGGGLARLRQGAIVNVTSRQGLVDDVISQIVPGDGGYLWLGCNRGIMRMQRQEVEDLAAGRTPNVQVSLFDENEGMLNGQCVGGSSPGAFRSRNGHLWFPTASGVVEIDPGQMPTTISEPPRPDIQGVLVDGHPLNWGTRLVVPPGSRHVEVDYGAPSLLGADRVRFAFRLEPLDQNWIFSGSRRSAFYSNLRPGSYEFRVTACNQFRNWSKEAASLSIVVAAYYWQTLWFKSLVAAVVGGALFAWYYRRKLRVQQQLAAREAFTRELMLSQEAERKRLASELHDGLGQDLLLIKNRLALLSAKNRPAPACEQELRELSRSASQAIADVRVISQGLCPTALEQIGLTKAIEHMVEQIAQTTSTRFAPELQSIDQLLPRDLEIHVYRVVQEGLNNVVKHAKATEVIVQTQRADSTLTVSLLDNGCGFDSAASHNRQRWPGFGLRGMAERAKVLGGRLEIQSTAGKGTRLTLIVPLPANGKKEYERANNSIPGG